MYTDLVSVGRSLLRARGFTLVIVLTLALGIGSAAAIFSTVDWMLFQSQGFPPELYLIGAKPKVGELNPLCFEPQLRAYREQTNVFTEIQLAAPQAGNVVLDGNPLTVNALAVSPGLLPMLNARPVLGRGFIAGEDVAGRNDVVVISYDCWQRHFGGAPDVLGRKITMDKTVCTVVGVLPKNQMFPVFFGAEIYRPYVLRSNPANPFASYYFTLGRLRPGVSREVAEAALTGVKLDQAAMYLTEFRPALSTLAELRKIFHPEVLGALLGAVGFLYAIACLNSTNLMLVRLLGRWHEFSIRLALGASRWRIVRLVAIESVCLACLASLVGVLIANWMHPLFLLMSGNSPWGDKWILWTLDGRAIAVLGMLTVFTVLAIVAVPAFRILRADPATGLKEGATAVGESPGLRRLRGTFVVLQAAFAVVLLTGAGLMVKTFSRLQGVDLGFKTAQRVKVQLEIPIGHAAGKEERLVLLQRLQEHLRRVPGVKAAAYGTDNLLAGWYGGGDTVELADGTPVKVKIDYAAPDYPETAGLVLKSGRWLTQSSKNEVVISESFARVRYPNQAAVGQLLRPPTAAKEFGGWVVVGVFGDVRDNVRAAPGYRIYGPESWFPPVMNCCVLQLGREADAATADVIRRAIYEFDPEIVTYVNPLGDMFNRQTYFERYALSVLKVLSVIAITLTLVGLFSVLAYAVDRRKREFGLRLALGATTWNVVGLVLRRGLVLASVGVVFGLAGALVLSRFLQSLLFETPPYDPVVLLTVAVLLLGAAVLACVFPALRASRVDVARLLQSE